MEQRIEPKINAKQLAKTRRIGELLDAIPDWLASTSQRYQARELGNYYPSRYAMIAFPLLDDDAHVTFYPAFPEQDALSVKCNDWYVYDGYTDRQINEYLNRACFNEVLGLEFAEFHVTFRISGKREHVFYTLAGQFQKQTAAITGKHRAIADRLATTIACALLVVDGDVLASAQFTLLADVSAYAEPRPTSKIGFSLKKGVRIAVVGFDAGYCRVQLLSGNATYHAVSQPTRTVSETMLIPSIYVDKAIFSPEFMRG